MDIICSLLRLSVIAIIIWIILSYVVAFGRLPWGHPVRKVYDVLAKGIDPILSPIRRVIPPLRLGGAALDLSPLILIIAVNILAGIVCRL